jgi:hypothetical protein
MIRLYASNRPAVTIIRSWVPVVRGLLWLLCKAQQAHRFHVLDDRGVVLMEGFSVPVMGHRRIVTRVRSG